jgi:ribosomal protein S19E (S16A)
MKFKPAPVRVKQPELSDREKAALRAAPNGAIIEPSLCQRLKTLGLVAQTQAGWVLTPQGEIRLMFQGAR